MTERRFDGRPAPRNVGLGGAVGGIGFAPPPGPDPETVAAALLNHLKLSADTVLSSDGDPSTRDKVDAIDRLLQTHGVRWSDIPILPDPDAERPDQ